MIATLSNLFFSMNKNTQDYMLLIYKGNREAGLTGTGYHMNEVTWFRNFEEDNMR